eukprot:CAMPEP_0180443276 /NCGR_PEP_ID=MMETSP1036_2-20121128/14585_1 /TAXON_ID=632150 /ORGANISM="Azadinium spinosum, Strain 3D9" /LENGTH=148 /DNA_ID=CAMNT_0022449571 /DNA_START=54 /DNA_END=496 /DNA_ORIENTATION=-
MPAMAAIEVEIYQHFAANCGTDWPGQPRIFSVATDGQPSDLEACNAATVNYGLDFTGQTIYMKVVCLPGAIDVIFAPDSNCAQCMGGQKDFSQLKIEKDISNFTSGTCAETWNDIEADTFYVQISSGGAVLANVCGSGSTTSSSTKCT